jgi:AcrR family transcriptional regulator
LFDAAASALTAAGSRIETVAIPRTQTRATGRPRSEKARQAILAATADLLDEIGFAATTIEAIAARAGSSKTTVYRWWPNRASLAMDAVMAEINPKLPFPDTGSAIEDFRRQVYTTARMLSKARHTLMGVMGEVKDDPELGKAFREVYLSPRRDGGRVALQRGIDRGELRADLDDEILFDVIYGAMYFRLVIGTGPVNREFTDQLVEQAFRGVLARPDAPSALIERSIGAH